MLEPISEKSGKAKPDRKFCGIETKNFGPIVNSQMR
jgi:hypothetical protein